MDFFRLLLLRHAFFSNSKALFRAYPKDFHHIFHGITNVIPFHPEQ